jgi:hypothetical protein
MPHIWLPILISRLLSLLQATTLRERYYLQQQRIELLETAMDDIARINANGTENPLIKGITDRLRK